MTTSASRDSAEIESLSPSQKLLSWRETRDADRFKDWCLENLGGYVKVGEHEFHPAHVLRLKDGAVEKAQAECKEQLQKDDDETVCSEFPSPVAVPYHQFLHGPRDLTKRLLRMRDTWEGMIHLLWALVIAEGVRMGIDEHSVTLLDGGFRRQLRAKDLRADSLAVRIAVVDGLIEHWLDRRVQSPVADLIPFGVCDELRRLNAVRNGFSHMGAPSHSQARRLIDESAPLLHESLVDLLQLREVQLLRLGRITPGIPPTAEVEPLIGHARSRSVQDLPLVGQAVQLVMRAGRVGDLDRVLAKIGSHVRDLSPYFYCCDDDMGHHTRLLFFKKRRDGICHFEVVGESHTVESEATLHQTEFERCEQALLLAAPEGTDNG